MKKQISVRAIPVAVTLLLQLGTLCFHSHGAAGDVDLSFDPGSGVNGAVRTFAVQPDGRIIIGGDFTTVKGLARPGIARLHADGSGDITFNPCTGANGSVSSVVVQPDGKVLVGYHYGIHRLNSDGSLDASFVASLGLTSDGYGGFYAAVYAIAVQPDGKILIGGGFTTITGTNFGLARLNANGGVDASFDPRLGFPGAQVYVVLLQPDGKVLIQGSFTTVNGTNRNLIARLNSNGGLDGSFNPGTNGSVSCIALQSDGKVLIGGNLTALDGTAYTGIARVHANGNRDNSFTAAVGPVSAIRVQPDGDVLVGGYDAFVRLNSNGSLDSSFNPGAVSGSYFSGVFSIALQSDGKVLIGGEFLTVPNESIARLNVDGGRDVSFDPGKTIDGRVAALAVQPNGKVQIGGQFTTVNGSNRNGFTRLNGNGTLDTGFSPYNISGGVSSLTLQADGKVLVVGGLYLGRQVVRLNSDGSLDSGFQPDLAAFIHPEDCWPGYGCQQAIEPTAVVMQADGKVLIGGYALTVITGDEIYVTSSRPFVARFHANGSRDSSFQLAAGIIATWVQLIAQQPDGKVLVSGGFTVDDAYRGIVRLNATGSLDHTFNPGAGIVGSDINSMASLSDGKVLVGGSPSMLSGTNRHAIARLNTDGSLDGTFNPPTGANDTVQSLALQPDGKVIIAGLLSSIGGTNANTVARLNTDGSLDANFRNPVTDPLGYVMTVALQPDGKVLIGGDFTIMNGAARPRVARLHGDPAPPSLNIAHSNGFAILSWPATGSNFQLQETTNLSLPNSWFSVAQPAVTNAGEISVTVPTTGGRKFLRLESQ